jgi:hypothetical protein
LEARHGKPNKREIKEIKETAKFASHSAFRTFATLRMGSNQHYFPLFRLAQFSDENLPITMDDLTEKLKKMVEDAKMAHPQLSESLDERLDGVAESFSSVVVHSSKLRYGHLRVFQTRERKAAAFPHLGSSHLSGHF